MKKMMILMMLPIFLILSIFTFTSFSQVKKSNNKTIIVKSQISKTATPTPTLTPTPTEIPPPTPTPIIILPKNLDELFTKYSSQYYVDKELLKRIANCESGLNPNAVTKNYAGLFQFSEGLWIQTRTLMNQNTDISLRFNPEEAVKTAAFMVSQNHLGVWPNCGR